jgi:hypothetical protein
VVLVRVASEKTVCPAVPPKCELLSAMVNWPEIANVPTFDVAPPGLATVTFAVPDEVKRLSGTDAVNCVALRNVVERGEPFHCTVDPLTNPVPLTVSVKSEPRPTTDVLGLRVLIAGAEFD